MSPLKILQILCSLILTCSNVNAEDISVLINRLYRSVAQNNRPLVLIIDRSGHKEQQKYPLKPSDLVQTSDENENRDLPSVFLIKSHDALPDKVKKHTHDIGKERNQRGHYYKHRNQLQKYRGHQGKLRVFGSTPSPVLKSLLRYKNEVNCEANNECRITCQIRFSGGKLDSCANKCESKFECGQAEDYDDPCDDNTNECGDDKNPSTRGVLIVTDKPECTRC